jgi:hypothetical protein
MFNLRCWIFGHKWYEIHSITTQEPLGRKFLFLCLDCHRQKIEICNFEVSEDE